MLALQIFHDFGCPRTSFWLHFGSTLRALGLGETVETVVKVVNFRGLAPARLSLFTGPDCGSVSVTFFRSFL